MLPKLNDTLAKFAGKVLVPPIRKVVPPAITKFPPTTVVPRFAVKEDKSNVPPLTLMLPTVDELDNKE